MSAPSSMQPKILNGKPVLTQKTSGFFHKNRKESENMHTFIIILIIEEFPSREHEFPELFPGMFAVDPSPFPGIQKNMYYYIFGSGNKNAPKPVDFREKALTILEFFFKIYISESCRENRNENEHQQFCFHFFLELLLKIFFTITSISSHESTVNAGKLREGPYKSAQNTNEFCCCFFLRYESKRDEMMEFVGAIYLIRQMERFDWLWKHLTQSQQLKRGYDLSL